MANVSAGIIENQNVYSKLKISENQTIIYKHDEQKQEINLANYKEVFAKRYTTVNSEEYCDVLDEIFKEIEYKLLFHYDGCNIWFEKLEEYNRKNVLNLSEFNRCIEIIDTLRYYDCHNYIIGHTCYFTLTWIFGQVCEKNSSQISVYKYIEYLLDNQNSAEEQLSFSFEYLFQKLPEYVLESINSKNKLDQKYLIDHLVWGFLNNRYSGEDDASGNIPDKAMIRLASPPPNVLTIDTYEEIFYSLNPNLVSLKNSYPGLIKTILEQIERCL
ncbi:hypothetical protein KKC74_06605 [bacterium]|nr:hypothetical protein [bacterium]MBU1064464.1 hypothetical protein [bacterium]MBU1873639.1 hypothetical protein [bacterium]